MGIENLLTAVFVVLIFGNSQSLENGIGGEFGNLAENYAKWVQKTLTPAVFAVKGQTQLSQQALNSEPLSSVQYSSNASRFSVLDIFDKCTRDLYYVMSNVGSEWAIRMLDSDGKLPSGLLNGNVKWTGDYKECIGVYVPESANKSMGNFHGQYCTATLALNVSNMPLPLTVGVCIPDSCSADEFKSDVQMLFRLIERFPVLKNLGGYVKLTDMSCKPQEVEFDGPAVGMIFLLSVFGFLVVVGSSITVFEYFVPPVEMDFPNSSKHRNIQVHSGDTASDNINSDHTIITAESVFTDNKQIEADDRQISFSESSVKETRVKSITRILKAFFKSFCIFTNGAKILNTDVSEGQLLCVHGIRFLSMAWVILGHTYVFGAMNALANLMDEAKAATNWEFQVIFQGTFSVDTFFVLSGFLLTYLFLKEADKQDGKISWLLFYIHRYWRLTPVYMVVLGFDTALTRYLSSGPFWPDGGFEPQCGQHWWQNLLYINNFGDNAVQCFSWAWYLANDMQFYVISPIFLYPLWRWPNVGLTIVCTLLLSSWITSGVISVEYDLIATYSQFGTESAGVAEAMAKSADYFSKMYVKPYTRIGPYLIGALAGYLLYKAGSKKKFLEPWAVLLGWSVATAFPLFVIFGTYDTPISTLTAAVFNALSRSTFAVSVAWVIYACHTGHGDIVNKILSWKMFIPLSRLTYCAYLIHPIVIIGFYSSLQHPLFFSHITMVIFFFGFLILSYMAALLTSLTLESPMMGIEKILLKKS